MKPKFKLKLKSEQRSSVESPGEQHGSPTATAVLWLRAELASSSRFVRVARWAGFTLLGFGFLLTAIFGSISFLISSDDAGQWLKELVAEQTGGDLQYESINFSVWRGVTIHDLTFTPPSRDWTGDGSGLVLEQGPALLAKSFNLRYSLSSLLLLTLKAEEIRLIEPRLNIDVVNGVTNLDGISAFRQAHFPAGKPASKRSLPFKISKSLPVAPSRIFLPFSVSINDVGVTNFVVKYSESRNGDIVNTVKLGPVTSLASFKWLGTQSALKLSLVQKESTLVVSDAQSSRQASFKLDNEITFHDFTKLRARLHNELKAFDVGGQRIKALPVKIDAGVNFNPDYNNINIERLTIEALEAVKYVLAGKVTLPNDDFTTLDVDLRQNLKFDGFALNPLLKQIFPDSRLFGMAELEKFDIVGQFNPLDFDPRTFSLPASVARVNLVDLKADLPELGLAIEPANGTLSFGIGPSLTSAGSQLDLVMNLSIPNVRFRTEQGGKAYRVALKGIGANLITKAEFPDLSLPISRLKVDVDHVVAEANGAETLDVPFTLEADISAAKGLSDASAEFKTEIPKLLDARISAHCERRCEDAKLIADFDVRALNKIFLIAQPILQRYVSLKHIPQRIEGGAAGKMTVFAKLIDPLGFDWQRFASTARIETSMFANMNDVSLVLPGHGIDLRGFNNRISVDGGLDLVDIKIKQNFSTLRVHGVPWLKDTLQVEEYRLSTDLNSEVRGNLSAINPLSSLVSNLSSKISVKQIIAPGYLNRPVNFPQIDADFTLDRLRSVSINNVHVAVPDLGADLHLQAHSGIDKNFAPHSLRANAKILLEHGTGKALPSGIRSSGNAVVDVSAQSDGMEVIDVDGKVAFEDFSVDVPTANKLDDNLLRVRRLNGVMPFIQRVDVLALTRSIKKDQPGELSDIVAVAHNYFNENKDLLADKGNRLIEHDYGAVRPFLPANTPITAEEIKFRDLSIQHLEVDVELKQNWFAINQFMLEFLGGNIQGGLQFAFDPRPVGLNAVVHMTRLDTRKLIEGVPRLRGKIDSSALFTDPYIDAAVHLKYNIQNNEIDGSLNVTSIGKDQLRMILYYIDPEQSDPTIAQVRSALNFGEVSEVSVPIHNGYIGLDVGVNVLAAPIPLPKLRGFPIAQVVENFKSQPERQQLSNVEGPQEDTDSVNADATAPVTRSFDATAH